ncbi:MAG: aminoacyl-tRNA hydrolase [Acidobacteriaceae bacterium]
MEISQGVARGPVLLVGLGNPGIEYQFTPHNAGFLAIDRIAERYGAVVANRRSKALTATVQIAGRRILLAKPETYMNLSGLAVAALVREMEIDPAQDLVVLYDDIDLPLGAIRIRERGSPGSHNGAKSICGALGGEDWLRLRIGTAPEGPQAAETVRQGTREFVLTPFRKAQLATLDGVLDEVAQAVETILTDGPGVAMNRWNRRERAGE